MIQRTAWLKRSAPPRKKRKGQRRSSRVHDEAWLAEVRRLPCVLHGSDGMFCGGPVEADHAGRRPLGRKASDDTAIPLCREHHRERTDYSGIFRYFTADRMRAWCDEKIAETQVTVTAALAGIGGSPGVPW